MEYSVKDAVHLTLDGGDYPEIIPLDYGLDLQIKTRPEIIVEVNNPRKIKIDISTFRGIAAGAIHYYAEILADGINLIEKKDGHNIMHCGYICEEYLRICEKNRGKYDCIYKIDVMRKLTKEEIEKDPIRWQYRKPGDNTTAFYSRKEALEQAIAIAKARFGKGWVLELEKRNNNIIITTMIKDFKKELTELINKHGLEKEMRDTPDYILAQICIDSMAVFTEAIARRDEWHGFRKADEKSSQEAKHNYPNDCNICKDRFKCSAYMRTQPLINLVQRLKKTEDKDEKEAISKILRHTDEILTGKQQNEVPRTIKDIAENLEKIFGGRVEIHRIEFPQNKRRYRKPKEGKRK